MKQRLLVFLLPALFFTGCQSAFWKQVDYARRQGDFKRAESILKAHLQSHPRDAKAFIELAEVEAALEKWPACQAALIAAERANPDWRERAQAAREYHWTTNMNHGAVLSQQGQMRAAAKAYLSATILSPAAYDAQHMLGETSLAVQDTAIAFKALQKAVELKPLAARSRRLFAQVLFQNQDYAAAARESREALTLTPGDTAAMRVQAMALDRLGQEDAAREAYQSLVATSCSPEDYSAFAAFHYRLGNYEQAVEQSRQAMSQGGHQVDNLRSIAQSQLMQQNFLGLDETASQLLKSLPDDMTALQLLHLASLEQKRLQRADSLQSIIATRMAAQ